MWSSKLVVVGVAAAALAVGRAEEPDRGGPPSSAKDFGPPEPPKKAPDPDFRKARWGTSIEEVKASEPGPPESETDRSLTYAKVKQWGVAGTVQYEFSEGKLTRGTFSPKGSTDFQTIWRQFSELDRRLMSRYPKPVVNERQWKGYKDPPAHSYPPGALSQGNVKLPDYTPQPADDADLLKYCKEGRISCYVVWKNKRSQVCLQIGKDGCTIKMELSPRVDKP